MGGYHSYLSEIAITLFQNISIPKFGNIDIVNLFENTTMAIVSSIIKFSEFSEDFQF